MRSRVPRAEGACPRGIARPANPRARPPGCAAAAPGSRGPAGNPGGRRNGLPAAPGWGHPGRCRGGGNGAGAGPGPAGRHGDPAARHRRTGGITAQGIEQQGHGVDREVPPGQILLREPKRTRGFSPAHRVALPAGTGQIKQQRSVLQLQLQLHRAVGAMLLDRPSPARAPSAGAADGRADGPRPPLRPAHSLRHRQRPPSGLHHQVQIGYAPPGVVVDPVQQQVAHSPPHQGQPMACGGLAQPLQQRGGMPGMLASGGRAQRTGMGRMARIILNSPRVCPDALPRRGGRPLSPPVPIDWTVPRWRRPCSCWRTVPIVGPSW